MLRRKRKAVEISQGDTIEVVALVIKAKVVSKTTKVLITRGGVLKRLVRNTMKTAKVRPSNTK